MSEVGTVPSGTPAVTEDDAKAHAEKVRGFIDSIAQHVTVWGDALIKAYTEEHWRVLGYDSWEKYCHDEFNDALTRLNRVLVIDTAIKMSTEGHMSLRAIESATGISKSTLNRALSEIAAIEPPTGEPRKNKGLDGKEQPAAKPKPEPAEPGSKSKEQPKPGTKKSGSQCRDIYRSVYTAEDTRMVTAEGEESVVNLLVSGKETDKTVCRVRFTYAQWAKFIKDEYAKLEK